MTDLPVKDQQARDTILNCLEQNFLVEAGAGSGKTTSLVGRMAALILNGKCLVENLAAVTFTRKAAGELKERFQERLERLFRQEADPEIRERLGQALEHMDRAFIGTINSFCARLLRERPLEAGLNPEFEEIEGLEERLLEERAWDEYLLKVRLQEPRLLQALDQLDVSPQDLKEAYHELALYPDVDMQCQATAYPDLGPVRARLGALCQLAESYLPDKPPEKGWDDLQKLMRQVLRWRRMFDLRDDRYLLRLLANMDKSARVTQNRWLSKDGAKAVARAFEEFRDELIKPALQQWREYRQQPLMDFLLPAVRYYQSLRERENKLNFHDLLMRTAALLRDNPEVRAYFQKRYTHLLVDEFQDTDPIQAEVMLYLTGEDVAERDWKRLLPRPGALFVVGDPKQSIYRFRRADVDTYNQVKEQIVRTGGKVLHLTTNFRSLPEIVDWVNPTFGEVFDLAGAPYQPVYTPMHAFRTGDPSFDSGLRKLELTEGGNQEDIVMEDAERIASWVRRALDGNVKLARTREETEGGLTPAPIPGDFMVLVRFKKHMALYARALELHGIPYSISGASNLKDSLELLELLYLLQSLADPDNPVSLVTVLRGLFFGISDDHLYRFKLAGGHFSFLNPLPSNMDPDVQVVFQEAWERLQRYWHWSRELPPSSTFERIAADLGLFPLSLAGEMGKGRAGYIMYALELMRRQEASGLASFADMVDFLESLLEEGTDEELDLEGGRARGVRIMNVHKAKGLEAPVVILANPSRSPEHEPVLHVRRSSGNPQGYLTIRKKKGEYRHETLAQPVDWGSYCAEETKYQQAEEMRLLYVAATRAKNFLVVSTCPKPEKSPWRPLLPFLEGKPCLEVIEEALPDRIVAANSVTPVMLEKAREEIQAGLHLMKSPTYNQATVTDMTKKGKDAPKRVSTGRGVTWGNVIHRSLEALVKGEEGVDLDKLVTDLLQQEGRSTEEKDDALALLRRATGTGFWQRVTSSHEKWTEVPMGVFDGDTYVTGTLDLIFKEAGGWVLVDFKSDTVIDKEHLQELTQYYEPQVQAYALRWNQITGQPVGEFGIYFIDVAEYVKLG